jgi:hypothetical protein
LEVIIGNFFKINLKNNMLVGDLKICIKLGALQECNLGTLTSKARIIPPDQMPIF